MNDSLTKGLNPDIFIKIITRTTTVVYKLGPGTVHSSKYNSSPHSDFLIVVDVTVALKLSIFVVQRAAAPKNGVEFCQRPIGAIRRSLATSYDVWRRRATSPKNKNALTNLT